MRCQAACRVHVASEATMEKMNGRASRALALLYAILDAGERGYAVAAANVNNRALKLLFRTYARQRADFKAALQKWMKPAGTGRHSLTDFMAMIHRGRVNIFAAMTIGDWNRERVVLKEVLVGERASLRAYRRALEAGFPLDLREVAQQQYEAIQATMQQVAGMRGKDGKQLVVRLFDTDADAQRATRALQSAGFASSALQRTSVEGETEEYRENRNATIWETMLSGAAGGALWGSVSGGLAGIGVVYLPTLGLQHAPLAIQEMVWAQTALGAIFAGGFVGAMLGTFIGWGVQGGDSYSYGENQRRGRVLLTLETYQMRAPEASQIMAQINREARSRGAHAMA